jgi:hypothetical protein
MGSNGTSTNTPSYAQMQDNGQLCVYRAATAEQVITTETTPIPTRLPTAVTVAPTTLPVSTE